MLACDRKMNQSPLAPAHADSVQSPTDFWLDTYSAVEAFDAPELASSLATYSEQLQTTKAIDHTKKLVNKGGPQSLLFLRIQAAASYYSTNRTLMDSPPPVHVDISKSWKWCYYFIITDAHSTRPFPSEPSAALVGTGRCLHHRRGGCSLVSLRLRIPLATSGPARASPKSAYRLSRSWTL